MKIHNQALQFDTLPSATMTAPAPTAVHPGLPEEHSVKNILSTPGLSALVIDDEPLSQRLLSSVLEANRYRVTTANSGREGLATISRQRHDLILLALGLPDMAGLAVLKQLREWTQTPVVVLTGQDSEAEEIEALDAGADDYVAKPFSSPELLARLRAVVRRADRGRAEEPVLRFGNVTVNFAARRVTRGNQTIKLTSTEYALLRLFVQHEGRVLTHRQVLREVWGPEHEQKTQYLRVYVQRLRDKLEADPEVPVLFLTESGIGYRFSVS
jgi:two-component system KDP operon response regulator KdpE